MDKNSKRRSKVIEKLNILILIALLILISQFYGNYDTYIKEKNLNRGYAKEDIETIEEVREFFLFYSNAYKYDISESSLVNQYNEKTRRIMNNAQILLGKYGKIRLDSQQKLTYDKNSRLLKITSNGLEKVTNIGVDIPWPFIYLVNDIIIPSGNGSYVWNEGRYIYYQFGKRNDDKIIEIPSEYLKMKDLRFINSRNEEMSYESNSQYYIFFDTLTKSDYYIYLVDEDKWIEFDNIRDIKVEKDFISFIDESNNCYVYCIEHKSKIYAGKVEDESVLYWDNNPVRMYLPDSISLNSSLKEDLFKKHLKCK